MLRELKGGRAHYQGHRHSHRRFMRRVVVVCLCLVLLAVAAGAIYTWLMGKRQPVTQSVTQTPKKTTPTATPAIDENAPVGVAIEAMSPPMKAGSNASISIKTRPKAACSITVTYNDQKSADAGLVPKNADEFGVVMWTWSVEQGRPVGTWPVEVTCAYNGRSGYGKETLTITSSI